MHSKKNLPLARRRTAMIHGKFVNGTYAAFSASVSSAGASVAAVDFIAS